MRVGLALFEGDEFLCRGEVRVGPVEGIHSFSLFQVSHRLAQESADVVLSNIPSHVDLKTITLDMPIHESADWESIDLGRYTLASA